MENIFDIRFSFEQKTKDSVILKFSNKLSKEVNLMYFPTTGNALCGLLSLAFFVMSAGH